MSAESRPAPLTVRELCARLKVTPPAGHEDTLLTGINTLEAATEQEVAYVQKERFVDAARDSKAGLLIAAQGLPLDRSNVVYLKDVMDGVLTVLEHFHPSPAARAFVHPTAVIASSAQLGNDVFIGPQVTVGERARIGDRCRIEAQSVVGDDCELGEGCLLHPRVTLMHGTRVGRRAILHSGSVIGADGFRYEATRGRLCKIPQVGIVVLEDDVEVGANSTIDRAGLSETRIGARTKIDNLVHIAHNVTIGSDCIIVAQVGIAGSTKVGRGVMIAGQTGIADYVTIGDRVRIGGRSGVYQNIPSGSEVIGSPAIPVKDWMRFVRFYKQFSQYWEKMKGFLGTRD